MTTPAKPLGKKNAALRDEAIMELTEILRAVKRGGEKKEIPDAVYLDVALHAIEAINALKQQVTEV